MDRERDLTLLPTQGDVVNRGTERQAKLRGGVVRDGSARPEQAQQTGSATEDDAVPRPAVRVLADRLAAALVHHEPGWRLPRHSALARRYGVSTGEIDAAVEELIARHLVRRLADGQLYRASPAEYVIGLEGVLGLASYVDAMGGDFTCRNRQVSWRTPAEDVIWSLRLPAAEPVCVMRLLWAVGGEPAACTTTYLPADLASQLEPEAGGEPIPSVLSLQQTVGGADGRHVVGTPSALYVELQAPPPSVARSLRLAPGQPAIMATIRFDDKTSDRPVALTVAVLRADMFRLVLDSTPSGQQLGGAVRLPNSWTGPLEDWEA
jgi:DNA-binding GntR family transcriptional regulator